jgi:hypothetical protein
LGLVRAGLPATASVPGACKQDGVAQPTSLLATVAQRQWRQALMTNDA